VALRDRLPPPGATPPAAGSASGSRARRLRLRLIVHRAGLGGLRARLVGRDTGRVRRARFRLRGTALCRTDRRAPFTVRIPATERPRHGARRLRATIVMRDGRTAVRTLRITRAPRR
jgi:hypothetical protein